MVGNMPQGAVKKKSDGLVLSVNHLFIIEFRCNFSVIVRPMQFTPYLLSLLVLLMPQLGLATHYKLFVLTGQSNSLGTTNGGEADPSSGTDPSDSNVLFAWHNVVDATTSIGISGATLGTPTTTADFTSLQDQQGGVYTGSATHWGGEMEFARVLYRAGVRDFGIIKASRGGGGNTNWHKASGGHMYQHILDTVNEAVASLAPGDTFEIVGLLYLQGESDNASEASAAGTRLKELTDNLRADLPNASGLHTVAAGTTAAGAASMVNQSAIAASTAYIDFFDNTDLVDQLAPDGLHLNKAGKNTVGRRWAQAFFEAGVVSRQYGNLVFIGDSITQGGNGYPSYRYQVFKNLANAGVPQDPATGYEFVGSQSGAYQSNPGSTPNVNGQAFVNQHDGHWGWRAFWINARIPLPGGRYNTNNLGQGTLENWLGTAVPDEFETADQGTLAYTGTSYTPDTVVMKIGINDTGSSSVTQIRDDIATLIDQLRAANPNVRIHVCELLYANTVARSTVDDVNALLPALVDSKNAASLTSPVWLIDANNGFNPNTMTYDGIHPDATGEVYVGDRISGGLGIIEMPAADGVPADIAEKAGDSLGCFEFAGTDIYNTGSYANGWTTVGTLTAIESAPDDLQLIHPGTGARWLEGTNSGWSSISGGDWTLELRIKFNDISNGFILWFGTGTDIIWIDVQPNLTRDIGGHSFSVSHNNQDGEFHIFRVTHDPANSVYHLWRDDVLLTPPSGAPYDSATNDSRLIMGDYTSGNFGDYFDVTIDYVDYCLNNRGNAIYDGSAYINGWSSVGSLGSSLVNGDQLKIVNNSNGGTWIEGTNTGWSADNEGNWTLELVARFDSVANGFLLWLGADSGTAYVAIYNDRTEDLGAESFSVSHTNNDGQFHAFRVAHDAAVGRYHVFRDGERLTPIDGAPYDAGSDGRLILGDYTGGSFGNAFDVTIQSLAIDYSGVWIPVGTDTDGDGLSDFWEDRNYGNPTIAVATSDSDGDGKSALDEHAADTDPNDAASFFRVSSFVPTGTPDEFRITVANTSTARSYTLYSSEDLGQTDPWEPVIGQGPFDGTGGDLEFTHNSTGFSNFYRVEVKEFLN